VVGSLLCAAVVAAEPARPKIGLVLGGGGALGMSHIGVLKVLEEQRIPIDYIAGTSMGSIIAGLYASGMGPEEMQKFLESMNWDDVMADATPRQELFFRRKRDDQRYLFEMGLNWGGPKMGTGMAAGQKFNNLMQYITLRAAAVTNFDQLPIPFRAVATDLQSGTPFVIDHGNVAVAMRASMAVPGVFTPVTIDGNLLVDGGIVDNLPVDVVKAMGADIIIAVDVGADSDKVNQDDLKSLAGVLGRTYNIAQRPEQVEMYKQANIGIQPVLAGMTAAEFGRVSEFVPKGEAAARGKIPELSKLSVSKEEYEKFLTKQRRANPQTIQIGEVTVTGEDRVSEQSIRGRIRSEAGTTFNMDTVNRDLMRVYGIGEFEQVQFKLKPETNGTSTLNYHVTEKSWGPLYFKYGLRLRSDLESDADWAMLLNVTRMSVNSLGAEWRNELQFGSTQDVLTEFYQPLDSRGFIFLAPNVEYKSELQNLYDEKERIAEYDVKKLEGRFDIGVQLRSYAEFRTGPVWGKAKANVETGDSDLPEVDENYAGWTASLIVDRQDRTLFAREGYYIEFRGLFARESFGSDRDYDRLSCGDNTFTFGFQGGTSFGSDLPPYAQFTLGGPFGFAGLAENQFRGSYLGVASIAYRYRMLQLPSQLGRGVYAISRFDVGNVWEDEVDTGDVRYGGALGLGADTLLGPIYLAYGRADDGFGRIYFSLGTAF
jgi:NTE family protein